MAESYQICWATPSSDFGLILPPSPLAMRIFCRVGPQNFPNPAPRRPSATPLDRQRTFSADPPDVHEAYYEFEPQTTVVEQGQGGTTFFVLQTGSLEVSVNGQVMNTLSPGTAFGGLALLYNCPRTATVKALVSMPWSWQGLGHREETKVSETNRRIGFVMGRGPTIISGRCLPMTAYREFGQTKFRGHFRSEVGTFGLLLQTSATTLREIGRLGRGSDIGR